MSSANLRSRIVGGIACVLLFSGGLVVPTFAQTAPATTQGAAAPAPDSAQQEQALLAFRRAMAVAVQKAQSNDTVAVQKALEQAVEAGQYRFDLPRLSDILTDRGTKVPGSLLKADAVAQGMPFWLIESLVRFGALDTAKRAAEQQTEPLKQYRALCLVALAQSARYLNAAYILPPIVEQPPEKWIARTNVPGTTPGMVKALRVEEINGPMVAELLDCRPLEKLGPKDDAAALATLKEASQAIAPTHDLSLYQELSEIQSKMGDKPGSLATVQEGAKVALADWPTVRQNKSKAEIVRQQMSMIASDLEAFGDKPTAETIRKTLARNDFQQIGLPVFVTINIGALLIAYIMKRASRTPWASRAGDAPTARL